MTIVRLNSRQRRWMTRKQRQAYEQLDWNRTSPAESARLKLILGWRRTREETVALAVERLDEGLLERVVADRLGVSIRYLRQLHRNVNQYTRSGVGPIKAVARGETSVSISFMHDGVTEAIAGFPVKIQAPCEGTGYEVGSLSIIRGTRNLEGAKKFADWALTPQAQKLGADSKQFQVPSNRETQLPPQAPRFADIKLINYDFAKYGASAERKRLLERWEREVNSQPK